ncbi:hypothetical protein [Candidatus Magnetominusculus xianensis]|nr:hypothetical protein [Candidatus Magnetominusculus xianensis]
MKEMLVGKLLSKVKIKLMSGVQISLEQLFGISKECRRYEV